MPQNDNQQDGANNRDDISHKEIRNPQDKPRQSRERNLHVLQNLGKTRNNKGEHSHNKESYCHQQHDRVGHCLLDLPCHLVQPVQVGPQLLAHLRKGAGLVCDTNEAENHLGKNAGKLRHRLLQIRSPLNLHRQIPHYGLKIARPHPVPYQFQRLQNRNSRFQQGAHLEEKIGHIPPRGFFLSGRPTEIFGPIGPTHLLGLHQLQPFLRQLVA